MGGPDILLMRVEALVQCSPVVLALISDKKPNQITLLKNPCRYAGSLASPSPINNYIFGFTGKDAWNLDCKQKLYSHSLIKDA